MNTACWTESPMGKILLIADERGLKMLCFEGEAVDLEMVYKLGMTPVLEQAISQLAEYFQGLRQEFSLPLSLGGTGFQSLAWETLLKVPYAQTWSYGKQAQIMRRPRAVRAVGSANGRNPLPIIIPCHRIISSDGGLGGYSCGLEKKQWLLDHERANMPCD